jgi:hypothetical protein
MTEFWTRYKGLVAAIYAPLKPEDGYSEGVIADAEARLNIRLPGLLREFYLLAGRRREINLAHDQLLSPEDLLIEDGFLIFYSENQGVCHWGIALKDIGPYEPPVWRGSSRGSAQLGWELDFDHLSNYLQTMLCWQAVMGGLPFGAMAKRVSAETVSRIRTQWTAIEPGVNHSGLIPFVAEKQVLCLDSLKRAPGLLAGSQTHQGLIDIEKILGIKWDDDYAMES